MRVRDDVTVRETYCGKVLGWMLDGSTMIVTLGAPRSTPDKIGKASDPVMPELHVVSRLALTPTAAMELKSAIEAAMQRNTAQKAN